MKRELRDSRGKLKAIWEIDKRAVVIRDRVGKNKRDIIFFLNADGTFKREERTIV